MTDYNPLDWSTGDQFTAGDATEMSHQIDEEETINVSQEAQLTALGERITALEALDPVSWWPVEKLTTGFCFPHRILAGTSLAMISGRVQLEFFRAPETANRTQILKYTGTTPQSGTAPTLIKMGVYSVADNYDLTRIAVTANDTTIFNATNASALKSFLAPCPFVRGNLYASALLIITTGTIPTIWGPNNIGAGQVGTVEPRWAAQVASQTDLQPTIPGASVGPAASTVTWTRFL